MNMLELNSLTLGYGKQPVVQHLDVKLRRGSLTAVVGPNGAGKTTLMRAIVGELRPLSGKILRHAAGLAWLPQQAALDRAFPIDVRAFVAMGLWRRIGAFGRLGADGHRRVDVALAEVGLSGFGHHPIATLSGGQMQRVLFARLCLQEAELVVLDEPLTAIDVETASDLLVLIGRWHAEGRTVLAVLHDLEVVRRHFPDTLLLSREKIAHGATVQVLTPANLARAQRSASRFGNASAATDCQKPGTSP